MEGGKYTFIYNAEKQYKAFNDKNIQDLFMKWSLMGHINLQTYCFNQPFLLYKKHDFALAFFQDSVVESTLKTMSMDGSWNSVGFTATTVDVEHIPCTAISTAMFRTLKNPSNNIIRGDGHILQCLYDEISGIAVEDELRRMLLDPESENYNLISEANRKEFLFCLFKHLCLGGQWCQYEDDINVYINITKTLYKDIIKVQKNPDTKEISTVSVVLKVVARGKENMAYFPPKPENEQNFAYLIIDPISRQITTLIHQYEGQFQCQ